MNIESNLANAPMWLVIGLVVLLVFCECAFLFGVFFPGDSMLVFVGTLANNHHYGYWNMIMFTILVFLSTFVGNHVGYWFGFKGGRKFLVREGGKYLTLENLEKAHNFMNKYGVWSVLISRWIPWVRTLLPVVAGAVKMNKKTYTWGSFMGAVTWAPVLLWLGYLGAKSLTGFAELNKYLTYILLVGLLIGIVIGVTMFTKEFRKPQKVVYLEDKEEK